MNILKSILVVTALLITTRAALARNCTCCPDCNKKVCVATPEETTVDRHCYEVKCKEICIPKFQLPWAKTNCCRPKCGRVRTIHVLIKVDYECKACGCTWEIVDVQSNDCASPASDGQPAEK